MYGVQWKNFRSLLSLSTLWIPAIEFRPGLGELPFLLSHLIGFQMRFVMQPVDLLSFPENKLATLKLDDEGKVSLVYKSSPQNGFY